MQSRLYKAGWKLLDVLFPPRCAGCGTWGKRYCPACFNQAKLITSPLCQICGEPQQGPDVVICKRCRDLGVAFSAIRSWAVFSEPLQSAIHQLKYRQDRGLGSVLAQPLIDLLEHYHWKIDLILPVPLDNARRRERGYNQAALLARPISWQTGIPYSEAALIREKVTRQQVGLSVSERAENMAGAFRADKKGVYGKIVLVIDDVVTTGATLNACAAALINAGAAQVYGITLARSTHN